MARTSFDRSSFTPSEATENIDNNDPLMGAEFRSDFDEAMKGAPSNEVTRSLPNFNAENQQISQIEEEIERREDQDIDASLLAKQIKILNEIKNTIKRISFTEEAKKRGESGNNPNLVKTTERQLLKYNQELSELRSKLTALASADEFERKFDAENQQISQIEEEIERREDQDIYYSSLVKQRKILDEIKNLIKRISFTEEAKKRGESGNNPNLVKTTERQLLKYNQELSELRSKLQEMINADESNKSKPIETITEPKTEFKVASAENVKRIVYSLLKDLKVDPFLLQFIGDDAILIEDLLAKAKLKDNKLILDPKILANFVSNKLTEAKTGLDAAGIKLDKYGEPKVGILSRVFTNKAINQKNDPVYRKYSMLRNLSNALTTTMPSNYASLLGNDYIKEAQGYRTPEKSEVINKALAEAATTPSTRSSERLDKIADKAVTAGILTAAMAIPGAAGMALAEKYQPEPKIQKPANVTKASTVTAQPAGGYSPKLAKESKRLDQLVEPEERADKRGLADVEKTKLKKPVKNTRSPNVKSRNEESQQEDEEPQATPYDTKLAEPTEREKRGLPQTAYPSALNYVENPNSASQQYSEAFVPYLEPAKKNPEAKVTSPKTMANPETNDTNLENLFSQVLLLDTGEKIKLSDYVAHIRKYKPELVEALKEISANKKGSAGKKFMDLDKLAINNGIPKWSFAKTARQSLKAIGF